MKIEYVDNKKVESALKLLGEGLMEHVSEQYRGAAHDKSFAGIDISGKGVVFQLESFTFGAGDALKGFTVKRSWKQIFEYATDAEAYRDHPDHELEVLAIAEKELNGVLKAVRERKAVLAVKN